MARRITFGKLIAAIRHDVPRVQDVNFASELVADIITTVWNAQDFRETLAQLPPFYLVGDMQDYGAPVFTVPTDFQALRAASLVKLTYSDNEVVRNVYPLLVKTRQAPLKRYGQRPELVSFEPQENCFRIFPVLGSSTPTNEWLVEGVYKKLPQSNLYDTTNIIGIPVLTSDITPANYPQLLLPLDDRHYATMKDVAVMIAKKLAGGLNQDSMATEQYINNKLRQIAISEGLDLGTSNITPFEPLMGDSYGFFIPSP